MRGKYLAQRQARPVTLKSAFMKTDAASTVTYRAWLGPDGRLTCGVCGKGKLAPEAGEKCPLCKAVVDELDYAPARVNQ